MYSQIIVPHTRGRYCYFPRNFFWRAAKSPTAGSVSLSDWLGGLPWIALRQEYLQTFFVSFGLH
jgi:hypothetical protein